MSYPIQQTRFKIVLLGLALGLIEGIIRIYAEKFPVIEVFGFQSALIAGYFTIKTTSNIKRMKFETEDARKKENGGTR